MMALLNKSSAFRKVSGFTATTTEPYHHHQRTHLKRATSAIDTALTPKPFEPPHGRRQKKASHC
jgi:hypothetical protein